VGPQREIENVREFAPLSDAPVLAEALGGHVGVYLQSASARGSRTVRGRHAYDDETVSRLRPFARLRFRTVRPFLVAMRTRNPCVRLRRRRFG
jgi:hypothetical protein